MSTTKIRKYHKLSTSVCVDWLTITANTQSRKKEVWNRFERYKQALEMLSEVPKEWYFRGYKGLQIGSIRWGTREDTDILVLSGLDAQALWSVFLPLSTNCSRVDLAVTVETKRCHPRLLQIYADELYALDSFKERQCVLLNNVDGLGKTLQVCKRISDEFGRVYDKGAQLQDPLRMHRLWRYEVEYKNERARAMGLALKQRIGSKSVAADIADTVYRWFDERDIPPIWNKGTSGIMLERQATVTSSSQSLHWLTTQVKPTVQKLLAKGYTEEVLAALGIE